MAADPLNPAPTDAGAERAPLVSIGLNCYQAERWIGSCLDSLLDQTEADFEIVIADNGSRDRTVEICRAYASRDPRIQVHTSDRNLGLAANLNRVFFLSRGKYFFWASANDLYGPRFIESCIEPLDADPRVVLVGVRPMVFENDITQATPRGTVLAAQFTDQRAHMLDVMSTMIRDAHLFRGIYRRSALAQMMPLPPRFGQDQVTLVRLAALGRLIQLNGPHYFERWAPGASTHTIPMTRRIHHYEPQAGWSCYLFHRIRNVADFWRVGMAQANGAIDSGRLALRLAPVTAPLVYQALRDDLVDLLVIALDFARIPIPRRRKSLAH